MTEPEVIDGWTIGGSRVWRRARSEARADGWTFDSGRGQTGHRGMFCWCPLHRHGKVAAA